MDAHLESNLTRDFTSILNSMNLKSIIQSNDNELKHLVQNKFLQRMHAELFNSSRAKPSEPQMAGITTTSSLTYNPYMKMVAFEAIRISTLR